MSVFGFLDDLGMSGAILIVAKIAMFFVIVLAAILIVKIINMIIKKALIKKKFDDMFVNFVCKISAVLLYLVFVLSFLSYLNVDITPLLAILGTLGLAIGLALKDNMSNLASGLMVLVNKPFEKGDYIECSGDSGTIEEVDFFNTKLISVDNKVMYVPNSKFSSNTVINYTREDIRRVDITIGVGYTQNIDKVKEAILRVINTNENILQNPTPPFVGLTELADSSINFSVRAWVDTAKYWEVYFFLNENIKKEFDKENIEIPFPQMDVHMYNN